MQRRAVRSLASRRERGEAITELAASWETVARQQVTAGGECQRARGGTASAHGTAITSRSASGIGGVKTNHGWFPKDFIEAQLDEMCAGTSISLKCTIEGVELIAVGCKYNSKKVSVSS